MSKVILRHRWSEGLIVLAARYSYQNEEVFCEVKFQSVELGLQPGGLLSAVLKDLACPISRSLGQKLSESVQFLATDEKACEILNTQPAQVSPHDIKYLFQILDLLVSSSDAATKYQCAVVTRAQFRRCTALLANGQPIANVDVQPISAPKPPPTACLSNYFNSTIPDPQFRQPLHFCLANIPKQAWDEFTANHLIARQSQILEHCHKVFSAHSELAARVNALKLSAPTGIDPRTSRSVQSGGGPSKHYAPRLPPLTRFHLAVLAASKRLSGIKGDGRLTVSLMVGKQAPLVDLCINSYALDVRYLVVADVFLSPLVLISAYAALLAATGWNGSTLQRLTPSNIRKTRTGYELTSVKPKTDDIQTRRLSSAVKTSRPENSTPSSDSIDEQPDEPVASINNEVGVTAISLLLEQIAIADKLGLSRPESLFILVVLDNWASKPHFYAPDLPRILRIFAKKFAIPELRAATIRKQALNISRHTKNSTLSTAQAFGGHSSVTTTIKSYLSTDFSSFRNEANILDFQNLLQASMNIVAGREDAIPTHYRKRARSNNLLFPPGILEESQANTIVDSWLDAAGDFQFSVGEREIYHCVAQRHFYKNYSRTLLRANPTRFNEKHKPRIAFCEAMYQIIAVSSAAGILSRYEREIYAHQTS